MVTAIWMVNGMVWLGTQVKRVGNTEIYLSGGYTTSDKFFNASS
jgi:hypothetical protein